LRVEVLARMVAREQPRSRYHAAGCSKVGPDV
jgi:hypothetical protein